MNKYLQTDWREGMICRISLSSLFLLGLFLLWHRKTYRTFVCNQERNTIIAKISPLSFFCLKEKSITQKFEYMWPYPNITVFLFSVNPDVRLRIERIIVSFEQISLQVSVYDWYCKFVLYPNCVYTAFCVTRQSPFNFQQLQNHYHLEIVRWFLWFICNILPYAKLGGWDDSL